MNAWKNGCSQRREFTSQDAGSEIDVHGMERLPLRREGWNFWDWEGRKIHYITAGFLQTPRNRI